MCVVVAVLFRRFMTSKWRAHDLRSILSVHTANMASELQADGSECEDDECDSAREDEGKAAAAAAARPPHPRVDDSADISRDDVVLRMLLNGLSPSPALATSCRPTTIVFPTPTCRESTLSAEHVHRCAPQRVSIWRLQQLNSTPPAQTHS